VGNLVGAIRLNAHLIDGEASALALARASVEIDDSASRIRSLLALVRPLLGGQPGEGKITGSDALLRDVRDAVEEYGGRGVRFAFDTADPLPDVAGRPDVLHHLLVSLACYAVEEARPRGRVRVSAGPDRADRIAFQVEDDGTPDDVLADFRLSGRTGRALLCRMADALLEPWGGSVSAAREGDTTRIALSLPRAAPR